MAYSFANVDVTPLLVRLATNRCFPSCSLAFRGRQLCQPRALECQRCHAALPFTHWRWLRLPWATNRRFPSCSFVLQCRQLCAQLTNLPFFGCQRCHQLCLSLVALGNRCCGRAGRRSVLVRLRCGLLHLLEPFALVALSRPSLINLRTMPHSQSVPCVSR